MYDFIVVGAGSAGCVVAARLSAEPGVRVLLLEAGDRDWRPRIHIPAAFGQLFKTDVDWQYHTEEQTQLRGRKLYWPRGKVLGGSSSINAMIYVRGAREDYDAWREQGNDGWGFADVLPYFKQAEDHEGGASPYHGAGGPLRVGSLRCINPLSHVFVEAAVQAGIPRNEDFNGPTQEGVGFYAVTQKGGRRASAAAAFLKPVRRRRNLTVVTGAHVTCVRFEGTRAVGVEFLHRGRVQQARTGGEVILCGGAVNSPQLLLLSGVGPAGDLERLGIPVTADLPGVGQNLQDHPLVGACHACLRPVTLDRADTPGNFLRYLFFGRGPLTSNVAEAGAFVRTRPDLPVPDLQLYFVPAYYVEHGFVKPGGCGFSFGVCLLRPRSRGTITLRSRDPLQPPAIQPNYLADAADVPLLIEGVRLLRRIARAAPFDWYRGEERMPGEHVRTDAEVEDYIRSRLETLYHPVGTCKMGNDPSAVVDARLRVHGTTGLRVVDASVMPALVGGNTNAPTMMIAARGADLILGRCLGSEKIV
jgi:choline dehydrogenase